MLASKLLSAAGGTETLYVDDVFSTYLYTGNGSTQTINNGIDLAGKGGLVWLKGRSGGPAGGSDNHEFYDTARGTGLMIRANGTEAQSSQGSFGVNSFTSTGFTAFNSGYNNNLSNGNYVSWTFRRAPKFFDCGTYTGNDLGGVDVAHSLGVTPGLILIKRTDSTSDWLAAHISTGNSQLRLNGTEAAGWYLQVVKWSSTNASSFRVEGSGAFNTNGATYVWYAFAHDPSAEGIIQCGSYVGNASATGPVVDLGFEPQFIMVKKATGATPQYGWYMHDNMRGMADTQLAYLLANTSDAESNIGSTSPPIRLTATGFRIATANANHNNSGDTYIYLAIRRPNKPPTSGTQVYNAIARNHTLAVANVSGVGFPPDLIIGKTRNQNSQSWDWQDRMRGPLLALRSNSTGAEVSEADSLTAFGMDGVTFGADAVHGYLNGYTTGTTSVLNFFRRATGVFDVCAYKGLSADGYISHNLGVAPELMIVKARGYASQWAVYSAATGSGGALLLNDAGAYFSSASYWRNISPSASSFHVGTSVQVNGSSSDNFIAYLFATKAGIQKITSFVGNGTSQTIDCGFSAGARFVCIKATSTTGDWLIGDSTRGLVAGNDPRLSLNSTAAEVTSEDWLDPHSSGFIVNQVAGSNANVNGVTYLVWAIA